MTQETVNTEQAFDKSVSHAPSTPLLHLAMMLTGLATALLGPILPLLSSHNRLNLSDQQSGLLLLAQFCGSFSGGLTVSKYLRRSLVRGLAAGGIGFCVFGIATTLPIACVGLLIGGWGTGQVITAGNVVAGRRYSARRGSALALLNFTWSFGAMLSPMLTAWLTPQFELRGLLLSFAGLHLIVLAGVLVQLKGQAPDIASNSDTGAGGESSLSLRLYIYFAALLFFYGGVETCLSGWLTTFALRYGDKTLAISEYTTLMLWASLTVGRAISSALLLRVGERALQRAGLVLTAICILALANAHGGLAIAIFSIVLGMSLSPFFPATFSLLMQDRPSARQAGVVLCLSGLGAAILPSLMGVVSTHSGSLQLALAIPLAAAVILLGMSLMPPSDPRSVAASPAA